MSAPRPPHINEVMIAAADLENAEFARDRLAIACGEAIRLALAAGLTHAEIGLAADLPEGEVRRLAGASLGGSDLLGAVASPAQVHEASSIGLDPSLSIGVRHGEEPSFLDLSHEAARGPDVTG